VSELSRPAHFEAAADALGRERIADTLVCTTDAAPVGAAIDRFVGAGSDTVYVHQIGPDQARLASLGRSELLPHYGPAS
jgi:coenzyme F420-dependent glucose-6-phosphate dehydrogenase